MSIGDDAQPSCAWATLLTSEHLLPGLVVFAHSLLVEHSSAYPLVIMATSKLSSRARIILSSMLPSGRVVIREIDPIYPASTATGLAYARFNEVWTKLRAFELTEYSRVALVDSDMLVRHNMDELFSDPYVFGDEGRGEWIGASWACTCNPNNIKTYPDDWIPQNCGFTGQQLPDARDCGSVPQPTENTKRPARLINSGLVLLRPSKETMDEMVETINTDPRIPGYRFPDQDFLADFFSSTPSDSNGNGINSHSNGTHTSTPLVKQRYIRYLPYKYNALKKLRSVHTNIWRDEDATNVHYILDKPWTLGRPGGRANPPGQDADAEIHAWWWSAFDRVKCANEQASKGSLRISKEDWQDCVEKYMTLD